MEPNEPQERPKPGRRAKPRTEPESYPDPEPVMRPTGESGTRIDSEPSTQAGMSGEPPRGGSSVLTDPDAEPPIRPEEPKKSKLKSLLAIIAILAIIAGLAFVGLKAYRAFIGPEDYEGFGTGEVQVEVKAGDNGAAISRTLVDAGVVASFDAFYQLSLSDSRAQQIQPGMYQLRKRMSASAALDALLDPSTKIQAKVTIPEGARLGQIVELVDKNTHIAAADLEEVLENPTNIGLPDSAEGNPEGFLFPDTYFVAPNTTAESLLTEMATRSKNVTKELNIETRARELGMTEHEILTMASILEYEGKLEDDLPKIARVLYNRLEIDMPLQLDSTVSYVSKRAGDVWTTPEERADPSLYNTYQHTGLPPGPIGSAGKKTIEAALNPAEGSWLYFLAIDLDTGETAFSDTYREHVNACKRAYGQQTRC